MSRKRLCLAIAATVILVVLTDTVIRLLIIPVSEFSTQASMFLIVAYVFFVSIAPGFIAGYGPERMAPVAGALSSLIGGATGRSIVKFLDSQPPFNFTENELSTAITSSIIAAISALFAAYLYGRKRPNPSFQGTR